MFFTYQKRTDYSPKEQIRRSLITMITFLANTKRREGNLKLQTVGGRGHKGSARHGGVAAS